MMQSCAGDKSSTSMVEYPTANATADANAGTLPHSMGMIR